VIEPRMQALNSRDLFVRYRALFKNVDGRDVISTPSLVQSEPLNRILRAFGVLEIAAEIGVISTEAPEVDWGWLGQVAINAYEKARHVKALAFLAHEFARRRSNARREEGREQSNAFSEQSTLFFSFLDVDSWLHSRVDRLNTLIDALQVGPSVPGSILRVLWSEPEAVALGIARGNGDAPVAREDKILAGVPDLLRLYTMLARLLSGVSSDYLDWSVWAYFSTWLPQPGENKLDSELRWALAKSETWVGGDREPSARIDAVRESIELLAGKSSFFWRGSPPPH